MYYKIAIGAVSDAKSVAEVHWNWDTVKNYILDSGYIYSGCTNTYVFREDIKIKSFNGKILEANQHFCKKKLQN